MPVLLCTLSVTSAHADRFAVPQPELRGRLDAMADRMTEIQRRAPPFLECRAALAVGAFTRPVIRAARRLR